MISRDFNSLCPFCNNKLDTNISYYLCNICSQINNCIILFTYYHNMIGSILIKFNNTDLYLIRVDFYTNTIKYEYNSDDEMSLPISNFDCIQDLLSLVKLHQLFS